MQQQMQQNQQNSQQPDSRRNSAIISAMAEKVAAVNQLVAEQQLSGNTGGSKSLNNSPVPLSMLTGQGQKASAVVVQKPIAMLPPGSSSTLTRRCVTVCEDPVKAIHLQQQHQALRAQLAAAGGQQQYTQQQMMMLKHGGSLKHGSSLTESGTTSTGGGILKPTATRAQQQQQLRAVGGYSPGESWILGYC